MKEQLRIRHEFVEFIPREREFGILYVSITYCTAVHDCFCGCGEKVVTPIGPTAWQLIFDGETVSLWPSIGSWSSSCRSHYFIRTNKVLWAEDMTQAEIDRGRARDRIARSAHFGEQLTEPSVPRRYSVWTWLIGRGSQANESEAAQNE